MSRAKLSIIIPTLNEEKNLQTLLDSIKIQHFENLEIIVADAGSKDKTKAIAKKYGAKLVKGGLPARGRNEGAKIAKGGLLLFLDADTVLPKNFIKNSLEEFCKKKLSVAGFILVPKEGFFAKIFFYLFYNYPIIFLGNILPHSAMGGLVKKEAFEKIGGFDESITLAEDHYFARQVKKIGRFGVIKSTKLYVSTRRFDKDGWVKTGFKYLLCQLHMIFIGPVKKDLFKYNYKHLNK
jgi:glycosyltransferase involved in cell wall biosynthesis